MPKWVEPGLGFPPVKVRMTTEGEKLSLASRINYSKVVTIEHNCRVFFFGKVVDQDFNLVLQAVDKSLSGRQRGLPIDDAKERPESSASRTTALPGANVEKSEEHGTTKEIVENRHNYYGTSSLPQSSTYALYPNARVKNGPIQLDRILKQMESTNTVSQEQLIETDSDTDFSDVGSSIFTYAKNSSGSSITSTGRGTKAEALALLGDTIMSKLGATRWFKTAVLQHDVLAFEVRLRGLLKALGTELQKDIGSFFKKDHSKQAEQLATYAANLLQRHAMRLAKHVRTRAMAGDLSQLTIAPRLKAMGKQLSTLKKVARLHSNKHAIRPSGKDSQSEESQNEDSDIEEMEEDDGPRDLDPVLDFICNGQSFVHFLLDARQAFYGDYPPGPWKIRGAISEALGSRDNRQTCRAQIDRNWSPSRFLVDQYGDDQKDDPATLGSVLTFTGVADCALATSCAEYLQMTWPRCGPKILDALETLLRVPEPQQKTQTTIRLSENSHRLIIAIPVSALIVPKVQLKFNISDGRLVVGATGPVSDLCDVVEILSWMSTTMSSPSNDTESSRAYHAVPFIEALQSMSGRLKISLSSSLIPVSKAEEGENCWLKLVHGAINIATDFPIPSRQRERGVEIPISIIADWFGIQHVVDFDGGIVMKGPTAMLMPTGRRDDIIQWHLVTTGHERRRLTYQNGVNQCTQRAKLADVDFETIKANRRMIVGWVEEAYSTITTAEADCSQIKPSGARQPNLRVSITEAVIGISDVFTAQVKAKLGRRCTGYYSPAEPTYREVLNFAADEKVVLYDVGKKTGWLLDAETVLLHIMWTRNQCDSFSFNDKPAEIKTGNDIRDVMKKNSRLDLYDHEEDEPRQTWSHLVKKYWSLVDMCRGKVEEAQMQEGWRAEGPASVIGFDFMTVVKGRGFEFKKCKINMETSGGWYKLVKELDVVLFLGRGFGNLIQPAPLLKLAPCRHLRAMPTGRDYLAAPVKVLLQLCNIYQRRPGPVQNEQRASLVGTSRWMSALRTLSIADKSEMYLTAATKVR